MRKFMNLVLLGAAILRTGVYSAHAQDNYAFAFGSFNSGNSLSAAGDLFYNIDSGWIDQTGGHEANDTNYIVGSGSGLFYNDYFSFDLSSSSGSSAANELDLDAYVISEPGTYSIFASSLTPSDVNSSDVLSGNVADYNDLVSGTLIGSVFLTPAESETTVSIPLNTAGQDWVADNLGNEVVIGGSFNAAATTTPEPGTLWLLGTGLLALAGARRLRRRKARA